MATKESNPQKLTKKARRQAARRKRAIRTALLYFGLLALCIGALALMPLINRAPDRQNSWALENSRRAAQVTPTPFPPIQPMEDHSEEAEPLAGEADEGDAAATPDSEPEPEPEMEPDAEPEFDENADPFDGADAFPKAGTAAGEVTDAAPVAQAGAFSGTVAAAQADAANDAVQTAQADAAAVPAPLTGPVTVTVTAAGDCTLGGSVNQDTYAKFKRVVQTQGYDYFFSNVRHIFQADDLTVLNLEGPLTDVGNGRHGIYCFKGDPDFVQIMTGSSVELCNVANNHSTDFGIPGLQRTAEVLEQAGIGCCGYTKVWHGNIRDVRVTALGFEKWHNEKSAFTQVIQQERAGCDLLIVNFHWGRERVYSPMEQQVDWGHAAIDAGADLVIGTHSHVYGGVELYKGKYIAYGLGNFCFGGNGNPTDKRCLIFQQTFVVQPGGMVTDGGINVIPCTVSSVPNRNDFRPTVMPADTGINLLKAMARYSNFTRDGTLWMPNSYPEQVGLIQGDSPQAQQPAQAAAANPTTQGMDDARLQQYNLYQDQMSRG